MDNIDEQKIENNQKDNKQTLNFKSRKKLKSQNVKAERNYVQIVFTKKIYHSTNEG